MNEEELDLSGVVTVDDQIAGIELDTGADGIIRAIDQYLNDSRFVGDETICLTMPESIIKRHREKLNSAIWYVYGKASGSGFKMTDILIALSTMLDENKLAVILDNDIKLVLANEKGIVISEEELDRIAANIASAGKSSKKKKQQVVEETCETEDDEQPEGQDQPEIPAELPELDITTELDDEEAAIAAAIMKEI